MTELIGRQKPPEKGKMFTYGWRITRPMASQLACVRRLHLLCIWTTQLEGQPHASAQGMTMSLLVQCYCAVLAWSSYNSCSWMWLSCGSLWSAIVCVDCRCTYSTVRATFLPGSPFLSASNWWTYAQCQLSYTPGRWTGDCHHVPIDCCETRIFRMFEMFAYFEWISWTD